MIADLDPEVPFTILAFFPSYQMLEDRVPTLAQMVEAYGAVRETGLQRIRMGNLGVFARTKEQWTALLEAVGQEGIG
jgi:pyruvate-formate lyase-activating enzyme